MKPQRILNLDAQYGETSDTLTLLGIAKGSVSRGGQKFFELANHLGNVLVTISDKKLGIDTNGDSTVNYYTADVMTASDYYPFGMGMPERKFAATDAYRYGFNGKENDNEVKGEGNQQDYGMRIYDPRVGKFLSLDPLTKDYPGLTPYQFASNRVVDGVDQDGLEFEKYLIRFGVALAGGIDNEADKIKAKPVKTTKDKVILYFNGLAKSTPFGMIHQFGKQQQQIEALSPDQKAQFKKEQRAEVKRKLFSAFSDLIQGKPPGITAVSESIAPTIGNALRGDTEAMGELTGIFAQSGIIKTSAFPKIGLSKPTPGLKLNIYGESETVGFTDIAVNKNFSNGRPLSSAYSNGSASEIVINNSPIFPAEMSEIIRLSRPGTTVTYSAPEASPFFSKLAEALKGKATVTSETSQTKLAGTPDQFNQKTITYKLK